MNEGRFDERRPDAASKDLDLLVHALQGALGVIDDHDPDRNPVRCMRQLRRLLDNSNVRAAVKRLADRPVAAAARRRDR